MTERTDDEFLKEEGLSKKKAKEIKKQLLEG